MLVRNLTQSSLVLKSLNGKKVVLPSKKVVDIDELDFPKERIKKLFGRYIHILTEKVEEPKDEIPTEIEKNLEPQEDGDTIQPSDETITEEETNEISGDENNSEDVIIEDTNYDVSDIDELGNNIPEEVKTEDTTEEEIIEEPKTETKTAKKANKKNSKKQG